MSSLGFHLLPPPTKLDGGYVFTGVCMFVSNITTTSLVRSSPNLVKTSVMVQLRTDFILGYVGQRSRSRSRSKFLVFHPISIKFGVLIEHHLNTKPVKFGVNRLETLTRVSDLKLNFFLWYTNKYCFNDNEIFTSCWGY